jgi:hypothetical protein
MSHLSPTFIILINGLKNSNDYEKKYDLILLVTLHF